jgi:hypothetical protein
MHPIANNYPLLTSVLVVKKRMRHEPYKLFQIVLFTRDVIRELSGV